MEASFNWTMLNRVQGITLRPWRSRASRAVRASFLVSLFLLLAAGSTANEKAGLPAPGDILKKVLERARWAESQNFEAHYAYTSRSTVEHLDSKENVKKREERLLHVFPIEGEPYAQLVQKDGKPLSDKEARNERERERKFRRELAARKQKKDQGKKDGDEVELNEELVSKYRFELLGRENVNGRPAFLLRFEPKNGELPVKRKIDRLMNKLAGRVWVDEQDSEISRADLHLAENVSAWGGLLASVRKFVMRLEQTKVDEAAWMPGLVDGYIEGRLLVKSLHMRISTRNTDFQKLAQPSGPSTSSKP